MIKGFFIIGKQISLILFCVLLFGITSSALAELSCGDTGSCVIIFHWYYIRNVNMSVVLQTMEGVDESCNPLYSPTTGVNPANKSIHENVYIKFYWTGSAWRGIKIYTGGSYVLGENTLPETDTQKVTWSFGANPDWDIINNPSILFPEGCSANPVLAQQS